MKRAEGVFELLDRPLPAEDLAASLADIERLNAWLGGHRLTVREVARQLDALPLSRRAIVIDVGGGRGDLALHLVADARRARRSIRVIIVERDAATIALARRHCAGTSEIVIVQGDATALPLREMSADVAVSVLTLHHLAPDAAAEALTEMRDAARGAVIVNDLWRSRLSWLLVWLATRLVARHRVSWHDGPLSVRRAYSIEELGTLAGKARLGAYTLRRIPGLARVLLIAAKDGHA
jgi:SAM-dependent methyltransferase